MGGRSGSAACEGGYSSHGFSDEQLQRKYQKHGKDFGDISQEEYSERALKIRNASAESGIEQFETPDGNVFKYNTNTNEFLLYKSNGKLQLITNQQAAKDIG